MVGCTSDMGFPYLSVIFCSSQLLKRIPNDISLEFTQTTESKTPSVTEANPQLTSLLMATDKVSSGKGVRIS